MTHLPHLRPQQEDSADSGQDRTKCWRGTRGAGEGYAEAVISIVPIRVGAALLTFVVACASCALALPVQSSPGVRAEGDGWRLLGRFRTSVPYTVRLATDAEELEAELEWHGIAAAPPNWDPAREVIAFFSEGIGSSCPEVAISDITIDRDGQRVYATFADPVAVQLGNTPRACTADLVGAQTFVVALARDGLPAGPFRLALEEDVVGCHPDCGWGPTEISVTLE